MQLDPRQQGDARTRTCAEGCKGLLLASGRRTAGKHCPDGCQCWCHGILFHSDGTEREDAEATRAEMRSLMVANRKILALWRTQDMN